MQRLRITIEIDTKLPRKSVNFGANEAAKIMAKYGTLVYLATEIAPDQQMRMREIMTEKD